MLDVGCVDWFLAAGRYEDFCYFVVIANGTLIERALNAWGQTGIGLAAACVSGWTFVTPP